MAASRADSGASDIWVVNLSQASETRLATDPVGSSFPVWSPDGKRIVFSSRLEGIANLYLRAADGAGSDELLLKTAETKQALDWSRDGRFVLFAVFSAKTLRYMGSANGRRDCAEATSVHPDGRGRV